MESGQTGWYPKRGIYPSEAAGCEDKESLIQGTKSAIRTGEFAGGAQAGAK